MMFAGRLGGDNENTDSSEIGLETHRKTLQLPWHLIFASVFGEICPGHTNQPQATLDHIKQSYLDREGHDECHAPFFG
jgi:hypothetical protein